MRSCPGWSASGRRRRQQLIGLLEAGAAVEPGPLTARLDVREHRTLTWASVADAAGAEWTDWLRGAVEPVATTHLTVR